MTTLRRQHALAVQALSACELFACLPKAALRTLAQDVSLKDVQEGEHVFRQSERANLFYLLSSGQIKLLRVSSGGEEKLLQLVQPGQSFCELAVVAKPASYPVAAQAVVDSSLWAISVSAYSRLLRNHSGCALALMQRLGQQMEWLIVDIEMLTLHDATSRLVSWLLNAVEGSRDSHPVVALSVPKKVIASRLSIVPATFSRTLARLAREGLLEVHDNRILLRDIERLKEYAADPVVSSKVV